MNWNWLFVESFPLESSCAVVAWNDIRTSPRPASPPDRKYMVIGSPEQRQTYKIDFNAEYSEYRGLHARIEGITRQFTVLDTELKQLQQGTDQYKVRAPLTSPHTTSTGADIFRPVGLPKTRNRLFRFNPDIFEIETPPP